MTAMAFRMKDKQWIFPLLFLLLALPLGSGLPQPASLDNLVTV
jgi:hypothetical protein